jgi:hypothetical protein
MKQVLQCMEEHDLHLKLEKCTFDSLEVDYLGLIVQPSHLTMDPIKLNEIASWPIPAKLCNVCSFLGFANFYQWFIPDYSSIAHPLIDLTKKTSPWNWTLDCQTAFDNLKAQFLKTSSSPSGFFCSLCHCH